MDDIESRKKEILKRINLSRINAKIMAARAFQDGISPSKGTISSRSLSAKNGQLALKGPKTGEEYIRDMRNKISLKNGLMEESYPSQNSLASDNRIKLDGRVRDFLAHKRSVDSSIIYKKPWVGGSDHGKSSKTDQARSSLSSLSSVNKPKQQILESHTGAPRVKSILKPQTRPISRRSTVSKPISATSKTTSFASSRKSSIKSDSKSGSASDSKSGSASDSKSGSASDSENQSSESSESSEPTQPSPSKSIFSWFSKRESPIPKSDKKTSKENRPKSIDTSSSTNSARTKSPETPIRSVKFPEKSTEAPQRPAKITIEVPSRSSKTPLKTTDSPTRNVKTPSKSTGTPTRSVQTPARSRAVKTPTRSSERTSTPEKPIKSLQKSFKPVQTPTNQDPPDISRCQYCSRPFNSDRLEKHESICTKTSKTRKTFDSSKKRLEGTELTLAPRSKSAPSRSGKKSVEPVKSSNWRKKHEELINSLRQAKAVSAHIAKGGKASDIPIVVSKNEGTPCPHCNRKFGEGSFERHVQICANLKHFGPRKSNGK
jgi:hypothetical protein